MLVLSLFALLSARNSTCIISGSRIWTPVQIHNIGKQTDLSGKWRQLDLGAFDLLGRDLDLDFAAFELLVTHRVRAGFP